MVPRVPPTHLGTASARPGRGHHQGAGFAFSRDALRAVFLLSQLAEEVAHVLQSHNVLVKIEAQSEVGGPAGTG